MAESISAWGWEWEREEEEEGKGFDKTFGSNVYIPYLDCGDSVTVMYMCQNLSNYTLLKHVVYCM